MLRTSLLCLCSLLFSLSAYAQTAPDAAALTKLLNEFLAGASRNDATVHDRFWAEELVYTGSNGRRRNKNDVMHDVRAAPAPKPGDSSTTYTAEDIRLQKYGEMAVIAFRLVGSTVRGGVAQEAHFLNTGTFLKRNGKWQVIAWQATKEPADPADIRKEVATTEAALQNGFRTADAKTLGALLDETFILTLHTGEQLTRKQLLERIGSGQLKYTRLETKSITVVAYPDTAVVRGTIFRQPWVVPNPKTGGTAAPENEFYTLTFIDEGGTWRAVAMHLSRGN